MGYLLDAGKSSFSISERKLASREIVVLYVERRKSPALKNKSDNLCIEILKSVVCHLKSNLFYLLTQLSVFTRDRAKWVIRRRFALFEPIRAPYIST